MESIREITECCICADTYTDPKILPCIHTFCLKCLEGAASKSGRKRGGAMPCPLCRREFSIPVEGMTSLQRNIFMERLVEVTKISMPRQDPILCEICREENEEEPTEIPNATTYCIQCQKNICNRCCKDHRKFQEMRNHQLVEMGSQMKEELMKKSLTRYCDLHEKENAKMYCTDCKEVICVICFAESHQMHKCLDIEKVSTEFREQIRIHIDKVNGCSREASERTNAFLEEKRNFFERIKNLEIAVTNRSEEIKNLLDKCIQTLLAELKSMKDRGLKDLETGKEESEQHRIVFESFTAYCGELTEKGSSGEICRAIHGLNSRADELMQMHTSMIQKQVPVIGLNMSLEPSHLEDFVSKENIIGRIKDSVKWNEENSSAAETETIISVHHEEMNEERQVWEKEKEDLENRIREINQELQKWKTEQENQEKFIQATKQSVSAELVAELILPQSGVCAVTKVDDDIYALGNDPPTIYVFDDNSPYNLKDEIEIKQIKKPVDFAYSEETKCLYVTDKSAKCIWKITMEGNTVTKWLSSTGEPYTLAINNYGNILIPRNYILSCELKVYDAKDSKKLLRSTELLSSEKIRHIIQEPTGQYIVSSSYYENGNVRLLGIDGNVDVRRNIYAGHICLDPRNNRLFVSDPYSRRVMLFDSESLSSSSVLLGNQSCDWIPSCMYYDEKRNQLLIGHHSNSVSIYNLI